MHRPGSISLSFQTKILIPVLVFLFVAPMAMLWVMQHRVTAQFERDASRKLANAGRTFENYLAKRSSFLYARYRNLVQEPRFRAVANLVDKTKDLDEVKSTLDDFLRGLFREFNDDEAQVMLFTSADDKFLPFTRDASLRGAQFHAAAHPLIAATFTEGGVNQLVVVGSRLYNAVSVPVHVNSQIVAALTVFVPMAQAAAREFATQTGSEFILLIGDEVVASTLSAANSNVAWFIREPNRMKKISLRDEHYFAYASKIPALAPAKVTYALLSSYEESLRELGEAQRTLWLFSLAGLLISALVVSICVRRATEPLRRLRAAAEAVGHGDFSRRLHVTSKDELGALGHTFNEMSANLQQSRAELEKTLETLKTTQAQLIQREKISAVGEFVAGVAHELNNPLTSLIGFAELLQASGVDAKQASHLKFIVKSSQRCHKIVHSLLSFARQHTPERKIVSVNDLVANVLELLAYELRTSNIQLRTEYGSNLPLVSGDPHQLQQVILNILNNALQAIMRHQSEGEICIRTEQREGMLRIILSDNGPGISPENITKIFDPFFTTKPVGQGTGLGLSLCYGIIREHCGSISVASEPGAGATFTIELPAASTAEIIALSGSAPPAETTGPVAAGKRILIIDDEEWILTMTRTVLQEDGYQVDIAADGDEALNAVAQARYDLLVCDQKMPGLSGPQLYNRLLVDDPESAKRLIFMTGDVVGDNFQQFLKETRKPCLTKPFSLTQLRTTVANSLHEQRAQG